MIFFFLISIVQRCNTCVFLFLSSLLFWVQNEYILLRVEEKKIFVIVVWAFLIVLYLYEFKLPSLFFFIISKSWKTNRLKDPNIFLFQILQWKFYWKEDFFIFFFFFKFYVKNEKMADFIFMWQGLNQQVKFSQVGTSFLFFFLRQLAEVLSLHFHSGYFRPFSKSLSLFSYFHTFLFFHALFYILFLCLSFHFTVSLLFFEFGIEIFVSNTKWVLNELKVLIIVFSKSSTTSAFVGREIMILLWFFLDATSKCVCGFASSWVEVVVFVLQGHSILENLVKLS